MEEPIVNIPSLEKAIITLEEDLEAILGEIDCIGFYPLELREKAKQVISNYLELQSLVEPIGINIDPYHISAEEIIEDFSSSVSDYREF
jgi:hypothetical protein